MKFGWSWWAVLEIDSITAISLNMFKINVEYLINNLIQLQSEIEMNFSVIGPRFENSLYDISMN